MHIYILSIAGSDGFVQRNIIGYYSHNTFLCLLNSSERSFSNSRIQISLFYHRVSSGFLMSAVFSYLSTHNPSNYHIN